MNRSTMAIILILLCALSHQALGDEIEVKSLNRSSTGFFAFSPDFVRIKPGDTINFVAIDKGRFDVTKDPNDLYVFRVASLRNVAMTPPYFHDGSVATLPEAVKVMARVQLGVTLNDADTRDIVAFLESLTGELPANFATTPVLPPGAVAPAK